MRRSLSDHVVSCFLLPVRRSLLTSSRSAFICFRLLPISIRPTDRPFHPPTFDTFGVHTQTLVLYSCTMASNLATVARPFVRQIAGSAGRRGIASLSSSCGLRKNNSVANSAQAMTLRCSSRPVAALQPCRYFSSQEGDDKVKGGENEEQKNDEEEAETKEAEPSREEQLEKEAKDLKDQLLRSLAEQENIRAIAKRDVASAKAFAVTSFAKSLLDTSDNLSRAMESVPEEYRADTEGHPVLATLYEGIKMTDENLLKAFEKNGLVRFGDPGDTFDPNMHDALFEYPDPEQEEGTIGQVMKAGFKLNNRVIRPAEVGIIKKA